MYRRLSEAVSVLTLTLVVVSAGSAQQTHEPGAELTLGAIDFRVTTDDADARREFELGVLALHSFWYEEALEHFRQARELEPDFAMAYWGEAMAHDHPFWSDPADTVAARQVLSEPGASDPATERERIYLASVRALYDTVGSVDERRKRMVGRLREVARRWPEDDEARLFAALYEMSLEEWSPHDSTDVLRTTAELEEIRARRPQHPGAAHYLIHAYDTPEFAERGLPAALTYAAIAPSSSHAQHMPSHIFFELGRWAEGSASNREAWNASVAWIERDERPLSDLDFHALGWWIFSLTQQGHFEQALHRQAQLDSIVERIWADGPPREHNMLFLPLLSTATRVTLAREAEVAGLHPTLSLRTDSVVVAAIQEQAPDMAMFERFTRARTAWDEEARVLHQELAPVLASVPAGTPMPPHLGLLEARATLQEGDTASAIASYDSAVARFDTQPRVLSHILSDLPREERAALLYDLGRDRQALTDWEAVLDYAPRRPAALLGAGRAAAAAGNRERAVEHYCTLIDVWRSADEDLPALVEAWGYLQECAREDSRL